MLARGLARHCPVCGEVKLFSRWFTMVDRCPGCGLRFERIEGHWLGALGLNTIVSFVALFVVVVAGLIVSAPDFRMAPLLAAAVGTAVLVPLAFFPSSKTLWTAIDLLMRPLEPGEAGRRAGVGREPSEAQPRSGSGREAGEWPTGSTRNRLRAGEKWPGGRQ